MPETRAAFEAGELSVDHVDALCSVNHPPLEALFARDEATLVGHGRSLGFDDFHRLLQHWRNLADDDAAEDRAADDHDRRYLRAVETLGGVVDVQGRLAPIGGAIVSGELKRLERELFEADWAQARTVHGDDTRVEHLARTAPQRHADALVEMAKRSATMPADAKRARVLITVLCGYETFRGRVCELADGTVLTPARSPGCSPRPTSNGWCSTVRRG